MRSRMHIMLAPFKALPDKDGRQNREDERLYECYQQLDEIIKYNKKNRKG